MSDEIIELKAGEQQHFEVYKQANNVTSRLAWYTYQNFDRNHISSGEILSNTSEVDLGPSIQKSLDNRFELNCDYDIFAIGQDCGPHSCTIGMVWNIVGVARWNIRFVKETQPVFEGNYFILCKRDLELLNGYRKITGSLIVQCQEDKEVVNLDSLESLTEIGEDLVIEDEYTLADISGLRNLAKIGKDMTVVGNNKICTSKIEALRSQVLSAGGIGGEIRIEGNKGC